MKKVLLLVALTISSCTTYDYDVIVRGGNVYDGSGSEAVRADVGIKNDRIAAIGNLKDKTAATEIDATGLAVSPGFINMLSWATTGLIHDGRSQSDIRQGVTLEVFGEGRSMGPLTDKMKANNIKRQTDIKYPIEWTTLGEGLEWLEARGVSCNIASFVGATTLRIHEVGYEDRPATDEEMQRMIELARRAMEEGAMGIGSSLIYAPAYFASTEELIALAKVAAEYDGMYISHMRNEGNRLLEALDEFLRIAREADIRAEIYHLKASGEKNWAKLDTLIERVNAARAEGLHITTDMYTYPASSTGLTVLLPIRVREGGHRKMIARLKDPALRDKILSEMTYSGAGSPEKILLVGFRNPDLRHFTGKSLAEIARLRGQPPKEAAMDLIVEDDSRIQAVYFSMSEDNLKKKVALPYMSFCSDAGSYAPEGIFLNRSTHPRAYGSFARLLGKYVREEKVIPLAEAVHRLSGLPAENLKLKDRGLLRAGFFADVVVFDPETIADKATFTEPHQYAIGVRHVLVNGVPVLLNGEHTGARPGRFVRGPGYREY